MHEGVLRFVFRTRSKRSGRTEERVLLRASRSARLLLRKNRTCANFFFLFLATKSQVGSRQREKLVANGELATGNFEH